MDTDMVASSSVAKSQCDVSLSPSQCFKTHGCDRETKTNTALLCVIKNSMLCCLFHCKQDYNLTNECNVVFKCLKSSC